MNKFILLVIILAAVLTAGLYTRPKVVVRNEDKQLSQTSRTPGSRTTTPDSLNRAASIGPVDPGQPDQASMHNEPLSVKDQERVATLRKQYATTDAGSRSAVTTQLIEVFRQVNRFDSAAYYAGVLATEQPTEINLLQAGDQYFEAYTFAIDEKKAAMLGQKTRDLYQKALDKNPNLLSAKANMAMTYVNSENPMQGILLLRDVLQQDPTNELALFNMGLLSMRSNQFERAIGRFRQILVVNPASRKAKFYLGISLAEAGQKAEAKKVLAEVKQQEKDPQILAAIREYEVRLAN